MASSKPTSRHLCNADELAELARSGDTEVLDRATRCFGQRLLAIGKRHCQNDSDAEDAVQDALTNAGAHLEDWRGEGKLESWLGRIVVNACRRMRRGRKNDPTTHVRDAELTTGEPHPELRMARSELAETLSQALLSLGPTDRAIVLLSDVEGWKGPEIAERLEMSHGSVRTRLSRARARLREELQQSGALGEAD
jgi:RNA polymerase sigma-70 factor (ECF subfamily)